MTSTILKNSSSAVEPLTPAAAIEARNLSVTLRSKTGNVEALRDVSLSIPNGSLFVLLGPNGAGKTTLMRCITGLVRPTGGSLSVFGSSQENEKPGVESRIRLARMGVLIENPGLYGRLNAREYLSFFGSFYSIPDLNLRITELCRDLGLELDRKPVAKLSQGNRQKLQLIRSLLHKPELLLWDEPTDHLDPVSQSQVLGYLRSYLADSGATALVATHRLEQMENIATHYGFLRQGTLLANGSREEILNPEIEIAERVRLGFAQPISTDDTVWIAHAFSVRVDAESKIEAVSGAAVSFGNIGASLEIVGPDLRQRLPEIIKGLVQRNLPLASVEPCRTTLAEVYRKVMAT